MRLLLLSLVFGVEPAPPEGDPVELEWSAPGRCPTAEQVLERSAALLGRPVRSPPGERLRVTGVVESSNGGFRLELRTQMAAGLTERSMNDESCETLSEVAAVVIAVAIDPLAALGGPPAPPPEPLVEEEASPEPVPAPVPTAGPPPQPEPRFPDGAVGVDAMVGGGALPRVGAGLELSGALVLRKSRVEAYGTYWFPRVATSGEDASVGARLWLWSAGARGCVVPEVAKVTVPLCAGAEAGLMSGRGTGIENPAVSRRPWVAVAVAPRLVWNPIPRLGLVLGADLVIPVLRPGFGVDYVGPLHRSGPVAGRGKLGLEVRFL